MRKFLATCASVEETIGAIYRHLAESVSCDARLKSIWRKMAEEEDQHAIELRFASRLPAEDAFQGRELSVEKVEQLLSRAKNILHESTAGFMDEETAVSVSLHLEDEFMQVHIVSAAKFIDKKMEEMFKKIAADEEGHLRALKDYCGRRFL